MAELQFCGYDIDKVTVTSLKPPYLSNGSIPYTLPSPFHSLFWDPLLLHEFMVAYSMWQITAVASTAICRLSETGQLSLRKTRTTAPYVWVCLFNLRGYTGDKLAAPPTPLRRCCSLALSCERRREQSAWQNRWRTWRLYRHIKAICRTENTSENNKSVPFLVFSVFSYTPVILNIIYKCLTFVAFYGNSIVLKNTVYIVERWNLFCLKLARYETSMLEIRTEP